MEQNQKLYLFQLIKSLSTSEKGYVKKYCAKSTINTAYIKLFDAIDQQEVYDEKAIKAHFKGEKFIKQFSVAKNYLIKTILKSLRIYHSEASNNIQVHELLLEIELLYKKRLIGLCQKLIKKARSIIETSELYHHAEELAFWNFRVTLLMPYNDHMDQKMADNEAFSSEYLEKATMLSQYRHLAYSIFRYSLKEGYSRDEAVTEITQKYSSHPLLVQTPQIDSAKITGRYHNIWNKINEIHNDFEASHESSRQFLITIQENPKVYEDYIMASVIPAHYNLLASCIQLNKTETFFPNLDSLKRIPDIYKSSNSLVHKLTHYYAVTLELQFYNQNAHFEKTPLILASAQQMIKEENLMGLGLSLLHIELCYSIAYAHFGLGNYEESENWNNLVFDHKKSGLREDIVCMAHLLHLFNHLELGSFQYIDYKLRSTYNFIKRMKKIHQFEKIALEFIKKIISSKDRKEFLTLSKIYKERFERIEQDPFEQMIIKNFDIISILESKLKGEHFARVAMQRRKNNSI